MRVDCKFYESRTYASGDTVRACRLDLAPEAPWRCPADCKGYERKLADGGWVQGSLANRAAANDEPVLDEGIIDMLDQAEDIVNAIGPDVIADVQQERQRESARRRKRRRWWPFGR